MTNLINQCQQIDAVRKELIRVFSFFIDDELFEEFTISEDLRNLGMGFKVILTAEELVIGIFVSNLERSLDCKLCLKQKNVSTDWSLLRSEFNVLSYLDLADSSLLNDVNNVGELIAQLGMKINAEIKSRGIVGFLDTVARF